MEAALAVCLAINSQGSAIAGEVAQAVEPKGTVMVLLVEAIHPRSLALTPS